MSIQREESVVEIRTVTYRTTSPDGSPMSATVSGDRVTLRHEAPSGYVSAEFPMAALTTLTALVATALAAVEVDEESTPPTPDPEEEPSA